MKGKSKRIVSGFLSALTIISSIMQPVTTYAAEAEPAAYEAEYPDMEKVKGALAEDEIVTAEDYEVEAGTGFDVKSDFSGMKIHPEKVKVTYHEAKNQNGQAFDGNKADTYHAVYFVEPVSGHPSYHVQRNIVVREPSAEIHKEKNAQDSDGNDQTGGEDAEEGETDSHKKKLSETELNQALEALKGQDTYDEESGLKLLDVMEQFKNHMIAGNVDLLALEEGETVTFTAYNPKMLRSSQVEVSSGGWYYYADYGLGSYLTCPFTVKFGSVTATAYCIQPSKPGPGSGVYEITKLGDGKELSKVCYYGTNASGEDCFFDKKYPDFSAGKRFVVTHLAASYAEGSEDAFYGANDTGIALAKELYSYAVSQPEIPDAAMAFSDDKVTAYVDGNIQRTKEVTFQADSRQSITMKLPKGVKFHNVSTGKISNAGADVVVKGGTTFFLSAPLTQTEDLEQQEGRILRQGNQNEKVKIFRYVTENTFDAYMWQILENKQKFISQIMTSKSPVRACEDVDDAALSYAEIKALATGNPYIREKMDLDIQVSKLKLMKANHTSQKYHLETDIAKNYPVQIAAQKEQIAGLRADREAVKPILEEKEKDNFSMMIGGKTYTDRKEAGTAILAACAGLKAVKSNGQIGEFHGFSLNASYDSFYQTYKLTIKRQCSYQIEIGKDVLGNLQRISNALTGIEKRLTEAEQKMENLLSQLATAQEEVEKPFPKEAELTEKMERLAELNSLLNMDEKGTSEALGMGEDIAAVADSPRCAVTMAGRVSELSHTADSVQKPSVLGKLKQAQERLSHEAKNWKHTAKKKEQQL